MNLLRRRTKSYNYAITIKWQCCCSSYSTRMGEYCNFLASNTSLQRCILSLHNSCRIFCHWLVLPKIRSSRDPRQESSCPVAQQRLLDISFALESQLRKIHHCSCTFLVVESKTVLESSRVGWPGPGAV